jgi:hypothetical protein
VRLSKCWQNGLAVMCAGVEEVRLEPVAQRAAAMMLAHNEKEPALQVPHSLQCA